MRKTLGQILDMGKDGFVRAMVAEWEARLARPDLSPDERERAQNMVDRARAELARRERAERSKAA